jgi:hypothetical protein
MPHVLHGLKWNIVGENHGETNIPYLQLVATLRYIKYDFTEEL